MHPYVLIGVSLFADSLAGLTGGLLSEGWLARRVSALVCFAAGALLAAVFLDVLPEALAAFGSMALPLSFCSFLAFAIIEWLLGHHHHGHGTSAHTHEPDGATHRHRILPASLLAADAVHNIGDGAAVAAAFLVSPRAGMAAALAVIAHEVPQEVGDYALLRAAGYSKVRALWALAAVQLTAVFGAVGMIATAHLFDRVVGAVLSIAAGGFLYIGATDLLPEIHTGRSLADRRERMIGFVAGVGLIALVTIVSR